MSRLSSNKNIQNLTPSKFSFTRFSPSKLARLVVRVTHCVIAGASNCIDGFLTYFFLSYYSQLHLIEFTLFKKIEISAELSGMGWNKDEKERLAPNIVKMIERFNMVSVTC